MVEGIHVCFFYICFYCSKQFQITHSYQINEKLKKDVCGCVCRCVKIEFHASAVFSSATKGLTKFTLLLSPQHKGS